MSAIDNKHLIDIVACVFSLFFGFLTGLLAK